MRRLAPVAVLLLASCTAGGVDLAERLKVIRNAGAVGVQAMMVVDGETTFATSGSAPKNGYFRIGSDTKTFVATVVLQLLAEGRLALDDPVQRHLPLRNGDRITIRDLLRHTSGIPDYSQDPAWDPFASQEIFAKRRFQHYRAEDLLAVALRDPRWTQPGIEHRYANTNYVILGLVIKAITGRSWQQEVRTRIIEPLGLRQTTTGEGSSLPEPHAKGYTRWETDGPLVDTTELDPSAGDAGGAIVSTPADLARFFGALLGGRLLQPEQLALMKETVPSDGGRYGLGLAWSELSCGGGFWRHGGSVPGYLTFEGFVEDGRRGVVLSVSSMSLDGISDLRQDEASAQLIDGVLCAIRQ